MNPLLSSACADWTERTTGRTQLARSRSVVNVGDASSSLAAFKTSSFLLELGVCVKKMGCRCCEKI